MMGSRRCELCKTGKVRPMQLTPSQAVLVCDNHDCDYLFNSSPWDNVIVRNLSMHPLGTPVDAESWIRASNSSSSSSGVHSDIKSPLFSPASSLVSLTDKEVEFLLEKSYAPSRVSSASQCSSLGSSSWRKSAARGTREHGRSATKLGKRSGQVASALSINTAFDLPSEGMPAPRHSDTVTADTELEVVAKNEFFDMLEELDLDSPSVSKNQCSSDSDLGDLPPLDPWMKEEYKVTQSELGALGNIKSLQGSQEGKQFEGSVSFKGDMDKFSDTGVPFIPSAGSAFSQVPPSKVITPSCLAPVKEDMISDSLLQERGCDSSRGDVVETGDGTTEHDPLYAGALLADTQTSSPASSHGSEDSGYNEECRVLVSIKKPVKTQKDFGTPTQVLIAKDSGDFSFANVEEKVCTTNIKESSHPEEVIKYLIRPVSMSDMINVYEYNVLPAEVSPGKSEKSVNSFEKSTNALEVSPEGSLEKCSSEESPMVASVRSSPVEQNAPQLIEDTGATVALHCPRNTHSLLKQKSSDSNDSETSVTQNGVALINAVSEQNYTKPCITSEVRKEGLETEIDNFRLLEEPITSLFDISGLELGENEREDSSHISTEITRFCDTRQSSEVFQLPSASEDAEKMDWSNEVLEKMLLEEHHDVLGSIAMGTSSDDNVGAGTVQEDYGIVCQSEKDKQSSSCDQSQIEKCPTLSENVSRVDVQGDMCINIRKPTSPVEDEMNIEMNSQDSSSLCPDMGSIDKAPCSPEKTQPIRRGPGRPRGRGRPKNKNKSVPSTDFTTSRGAPTSTKVGASLPAGYVRESRSRKRRNLETRANNMPKEEDWEGEYRNEEDSADIRKGISGLLPSSYLQLARGRKSSKWSGGAKTAMYNCSSVEEDEVEVEELHVEVIVEGHRTLDLPLYLQHHLLKKSQREGERMSAGSQEQQQLQIEKMQCKSSCSLKPKERLARNRKYFENVLANMDFDDQFFQCPMKEHDKDGDSLSELSDGVLFFGQTGEEHFPSFKEEQRLSCDATTDSVHPEDGSSNCTQVSVDNSDFLFDPAHGLVKQDIITKPGARKDSGKVVETVIEKAAESPQVLASKVRSLGLCVEEQILNAATQNIPFMLSNRVLYGSNESLPSSSVANIKTEADLSAHEGKASGEGQEFMKLGSDSRTNDAVGRKPENILALGDTVRCVSSGVNLNQPQGVVFQPCTSSCHCPNPVQSDLNLFGTDMPHCMQQRKQVVQCKEISLQAKEQVNHIPEIEVLSAQGECSRNVPNKIGCKITQASTDTIASSLAPSTKDDVIVSSNGNACAIHTVVGSSRMEPFLSTGLNLNKVGVMNYQQGTPKREETLYIPRNNSSSFDSHQSNVQMYPPLLHTVKQESPSSPSFQSSPAHCDDSDNDIPTFTLDDMDEIHVVLPKKRKRKGGMGERRECKKLKEEIVDDVADCSVANIDFDEVPLCCGILDSTFVHEECCALRSSGADSSTDEKAFSAGQKLFGICYARKACAMRRISNQHSTRLETFLNSETDIKPAAFASPLVIDAFANDEEQAEKRILQEEAAYGDIKHSPQFHGTWSPGSDSSQPGLLELDISLSTIEPFTDLFSWSPESWELTFNGDKEEMVDMPENSQNASTKGSVLKVEENDTASALGNSMDVKTECSIQKAEESNVTNSNQQTSAEDGKHKAEGVISRELIKPGICQQPQPEEVAVTGPVKRLTEYTEPLLKPVSSSSSHEGVLGSVAASSVHHVTPSTSSNFPSCSHADQFPVPTFNSQATHLYTSDPTRSGHADHIAQLPATSLTFTDHTLYPRVPQVSSTELIGIDCKDVSQFEPTTIVPPALISSYCSPKPSRESLSVRKGQSQWAAVKPITMSQKPLSTHYRARHVQSSRSSGSTFPVLTLKTELSRSSKESPLSKNPGESVSENTGENSILKNIKEMSISVSGREVSIAKNTGESSLSKTVGEPATSSKLGQEGTVSSVPKEFILNSGSKPYVHSTNISKVNMNLPKVNITSKAEPMQAVVIGKTFLIKSSSGFLPKAVNPSTQDLSQISQSFAAPVGTISAIPTQVTQGETIIKPSTGVCAQGKRVRDNYDAVLLQNTSSPVSSGVSKTQCPSQNTTDTSRMLTPELNVGAASASSSSNQPAKSSLASCRSLPGSSTLRNTASITKTSNTAGIPGRINSKVADKIGELCQSTGEDAPKVILVNVGDKTFFYRREDK